MSLVRTVESFPEDRQEAYLGNGTIGYRVKANPFTSWKAVASGYVTDQEEGRFETMAYAPYPFAMDFALGGSGSMMQKADDVRVTRQSLDMSCGELTTEMEFPLGGGVTKAAVTQLVSRTCPVVSCQEVRLTAGESGDLKVVCSTVRGPGNDTCGEMPPGNDKLVDLMLGFAPPCRRSKCGVSVKVDFGGAEVVREAFEPGKPQIARTFAVKVTSGRELVIRSIAATVTSLYHPEPDLESCRLVNWAASIGFEALRSWNAEAWSEIWKSRVKITGDDKAQEYLDCALFYLYSSTHPSCQTSIAPFGLSQAANYGGHVFWDTDTYMTPALLLTSPETAKTTIDYRIRRLDPAKKRAQCYGYGGAMYPWESDTRGYESTPSGCATGWLEQHINMCVAVAAWQYQKAAGDLEYARNCTYPILESVAEWIVSRAKKTQRGYEIGNIMSADEEGALCNSSYVNALCAEALRIACECANLVGLTPNEKWLEIAEKLFIPMGPAPGIEGDIIYMHDGGWKESACVDSFMIGFPFDLPFDRDFLRRTYDFFITLESETLSMGHCFFAGEAAFVGDRKGARRLFHRVVDETFEGAWGMGTECTGATPTCFVTTMGGMLQTAMMAFTGIRFEPGNWTKYEACLPEGWEKIEVDRIYLGGKAYRLEAENGKKAVLTELGIENCEL